MNRIFDRERLSTRSILLCHLILGGRALGLLLTDPASNLYASLHFLVNWSPMSPDVTWGLICLTLACLGIFSWFAKRKTLMAIALISSGVVIMAIGGGFGVSGQWVPANVWLIIAGWMLFELYLGDYVQPRHGAKNDLVSTGNGSGGGSSNT